MAKKSPSDMAWIGFEDRYPAEGEVVWVFCHGRREGRFYDSEIRLAEYQGGELFRSLDMAHAMYTDESPFCFICSMPIAWMPIDDMILPDDFDYRVEPV